MGAARWLETDSLSNQNIVNATAVGAYTADADRFVMCQVFADQVAGNGDYVMYLTVQIGGAGSTYVILPKSPMASAAGETAIAGQSGWLFVRSGDIVMAYIDGLAGDTTTPDLTVRWAEDAALRPVTADRTLVVDAAGLADANAVKVGPSGTGTAQTAGDICGKIGTPANLGGGTATLAGNLADIEGQTDDIGTAGAGLTALGDTRLANLDTTVGSREASGAAATAAGAVTLANGAHGGAATTITLQTPVHADLQSILETVLTETAGQIAAAFKKFFNVETPLLTTAEAMRGTDGAYTGTPPSAATIAGAVLDEAKGVHTGHIASIPTNPYTGTPPTASDNATAAAAAILATPANKLATNVSGHITLADGAHGGTNTVVTLKTPIVATISGTLTTLDSLWTKIQKWLRLALRKDATVATDHATELAEINANTGTGAGVYANTTDSQEAIRDIAALEATLTAIKGAGWSTETMAAIDVLLDAIKAKTDLLDVTSATVVSLVDGGDLTVIAGVTFDPTAIAGLTIPAAWTTAFFTVKALKATAGRKPAADSTALIQIKVSNPGGAGDGLLYLNAAAATAAWGSLTLDAVAQTATIVLDDDATVLLAEQSGLYWDIKTLNSGGTSDLVCSGSLAVVLTPTKTI